ncbi:MAG: hypothetical protein CMF52_05525 [Legionellales bacterium]|nr:hypothetical protein [Legionellales bacterium]|tara:strand:- start:95 stop:1036 length:942 start_codon:yes stop_codon:yes gene_type:complete
MNNHIFVDASKQLFDYTDEEQNVLRHYIQPETNFIFTRIKHFSFQFGKNGEVWTKRKSTSSFLAELKELYTDEAIRTFVQYKSKHEMLLYILHYLKSIQLPLDETIVKDTDGNVVEKSGIYYQAMARKAKLLHLDMNKAWPSVAVYKQLRRRVKKHEYLVLQRVGTTWEHAFSCYGAVLDRQLLQPVADEFRNYNLGMSVMRVEFVNGERQIHYDLKGSELNHTIQEAEVDDSPFILVPLSNLNNVCNKIFTKHSYSLPELYTSYAATVPVATIMEELEKKPVVSGYHVNVVMQAVYKKKTEHYFTTMEGTKI